MLTQPLTRPLTRKIHRAQLTSIRYRDFDPLSLEPYLLFDAESSMLGNLENPTLDLDASDNGSLDVITATRSGIATFTAADGQIVTADPDTVRVDHVQGEELTPTVYQHIGYTDFSSGWSTYLGSTALGDGYNGQASLVCSFTGSGQSYQNFTSVDGVTYTGSFWARAVSASGPYRLVHGNSASGSSTFITLTSEWQFFSIQFLGRSGGGSMYFGIGATAGDVVEIAMPQVEEGTTATDFVPNTTGSPKFIASATYGPRVPMMLIEPSATNLLTYSEDFSTWSPQDVSISTGFASPDGLLNARNVTPNATNTTHLFSSAGLSSDIKTYSVYAKANGYKYFRFNTGSSGNGFAEFDVEAGTVVSTGGTYYSSSSIEDVGGGWFRCSMTLSAGAATKINIAIEDNSRAVSYLADGVSGLLFWGAQIEEGVVSTSYIPTSGSAVTRNADQLSLSTSVTSSFFSSTGGGTFYAEFIPRDVLSDQWYLLSAQDYDRRFMYTNSGNARLNAYDGVGTRSYGQDMVANQLNRAAFTYTSTTQEASLDGAITEPVTHNGNYLTTSRLYLSSPANDKQMNGYLKRLLYWPTNSSNL